MSLYGLVSIKGKTFDIDEREDRTQDKGVIIYFYMGNGFCGCDVVNAVAFDEEKVLNKDNSIKEDYLSEYLNEILYSTMQEFYDGNEYSIEELGLDEDIDESSDEFLEAHAIAYDENCSGHYSLEDEEGNYDYNEH